METAEAEWARGVAEGRYSEDEEDAEAVFVAARMVAKVALPPDCARIAKEYRAMLRSLEIPPDWLRSHGLLAE